MNIDYFIKSVIYIVLFIFFPIVFYFAGRKIANFTKYQGRIKVYLILTISSITVSYTHLTLPTSDLV